MTIFGPDCSHYQAGIDLRRAAAEGCQFVLGKVSQGTSYRDTQWPRTRDGGREAGLIVLGYHYVTTQDPDRQAANCAGWLGDRSIPLALDWEAGSGGWANFMKVLTAFRRGGLNVRLAYCPRWYWQQVGSPNMSGAGIPLWSSRYPSTRGGAPADLYKNVSAAHWAGYGGLDVALVQFTDRASIAGMSVDCSAFNGTREQLAAFLGGGNPMEDEMTPEQEQKLDKALAMLDALYGQMAGEGAVFGDPDPAKAWTGWPTWDDGTGERLTLVDFARRANVQLNHGGAPGSLSDADVQRIAAEVVKTFGRDLND